MTGKQAAVAYIRVSTQGQAKSGHADAIEAFAKAEHFNSPAISCGR